MTYAIISVILCAGLAVGMPLMTLLGYRLGRRHQGADTEPTEGNGAITGALFGLLGLMVAFTFSGAYSRFDHRRQLASEEINAIGTAYLRVDLLPLESQSAMRKDFREYVQSRVAFYDKLLNSTASDEELADAGQLQQKIWTAAVEASRGPEYQSARMLLLPALNEMFDIVTTRYVAIQSHPPTIIWVTLCALGLVCAGITGYSLGNSPRPRFFYNIAFAAVTTFVMLIILDIEYPRVGFVRLDNMNQLLAELAQSMNE